MTRPVPAWSARSLFSPSLGGPQCHHGGHRAGSWAPGHRPCFERQRCPCLCSVRRSTQGLTLSEGQLGKPLPGTERRGPNSPASFPSGFCSASYLPSSFSHGLLSGDRVMGKRTHETFRDPWTVALKLALTPRGHKPLCGPRRRGTCEGQGARGFQLRSVSDARRGYFHFWNV